MLTVNKITQQTPLILSTNASQVIYTVNQQLYAAAPSASNFWRSTISHKPSNARVELEPETHPETSKHILQHRSFLSTDTALPAKLKDHIHSGQTGAQRGSGGIGRKGVGVGKAGGGWWVAVEKRGNRFTSCLLTAHAVHHLYQSPDLVRTVKEMII